MGEKYTYETQVTGNLERIEWDDIRWNEANDKTDADRVLVVGDSISCGYRNQLTLQLEGKYCIDGIGTSKALDNPSFFPLIEYVTSQQKAPAAIFFNNGLHGWHMDEESYETYCVRFVQYFKKKFPQAKLFLPLTTPVRVADCAEQYDERNEIVIKRNDIVRKAAEQENVPVIDFYSIIAEHPEYTFRDGVHLITDGYALLAKACVEMMQISGLSML